MDEMITDFKSLIDFARNKKSPAINLFGVCGAAGAGKDTMAQAISVYSDRNGYNYLRAALADKLKYIAMDVFNYPSNQVWFGREYKETKLERLGDNSPREILQNLGQSVRENLGNDVWIKGIEKTIIDNYTKHSKAQQVGRVSPINIVVPDIRYPNEADWLAEHNGFLISVDRPGVSAVRSHETEAHYQDFAIDYEYRAKDYYTHKEAIEAILQWLDYEAVL